MALPHIAMVVSDDLGYHMTGYEGSKQAYTPTLNALVRDEAIHLTRAYGSATCSPARHALVSGRVPLHAGMTNQKMPSNSTCSGGNCDLAGMSDLRMLSIAQRLSAAGYATHAAGKWGLGLKVMAQLPLQRGFSSYVGYLGNEIDPYNHTTEAWCVGASPVGSIDFWRGNQPWKGLHGRFADELHTEHIVGAVAEHDLSTPIFVYLALQNPHSPYEMPPDRYVQGVKDHFATLKKEDMPLTEDDVLGNTYGMGRTLYSMVAVVDAAVANLTTVLRDRGMWDTTLFVFTADNGGAIHASSNYPLRGYKTTPWEGGNRVTAFVSGGLIPQSLRGKKLNVPVHHADWCALRRAPHACPRRAASH